jgi:hypothetical protein
LESEIQSATVSESVSRDNSRRTEEISQESEKLANLEAELSRKKNSYQEQKSLLEKDE